MTWTSYQVGLDRLAGLPEEPPGVPLPAGLVRSSEALPGKDFISDLRDHASIHVEDKYLHDRKTLWAKEVRSILDTPTWMALSPETLMCWQNLMIDDLDIDEKAGVQWATLVKSGDRGHAEGVRILHHLIKDHLGPWRSSSRSPSQWLYTSSQEALDAIGNPETWEVGPGGHVGPQKGGWGWDKGSSGKGVPAGRAKGSSDKGPSGKARGLR